jgi:hypothetical protein
MFGRLKSNNVALQLSGKRIAKITPYQRKINFWPGLHLSLRGENRRSAKLWCPAGKPAQIM